MYSPFGMNQLTRPMLNAPRVTWPHLSADKWQVCLRDWNIFHLSVFRFGRNCILRFRIFNESSQIQLQIRINLVKRINVFILINHHIKNFISLYRLYTRKYTDIDFLYTNNNVQYILIPVGLLHVRNMEC